MNNPTVYMFIGLPGSGKSTTYQDFFPSFPRASSDAFIEEAAKLQGKTYNEIFKAEAPLASKKLDEQVKNLIESDTTFVWDQTNLTVSARKKKLSLFPPHWKKVACYFDVPVEVCLERNDKRERSIPRGVIESMHMNMEDPTLEEGFDEIISFES